MFDAPDQEPDAAPLPRFGPLRSRPPIEVSQVLSGAAPGTTWTATRLGNDGGYPNGGIWRMTADQQLARGQRSVIVKRTGPGHLGTSSVWRNRSERSDPQWWGREAEFYRSALATSRWPDDVRAPRCHFDDHDACRDLWLEDVDNIPAPVDVCRRAATGLGQWQTAHAGARHPWLSRDWIATHVRRHDLDNDRTLAHPGWPSAIDRGLDPALRDWVAHRVTDPGEIAATLAGFPQVLTNHDLHEHNIGTVGESVVIIDWASVGWGPIGHDVGHLALSLAASGSAAASPWDELAAAYCTGLAAAGWTGDPSLVRRSMVTSNRLRMGWCVDHLLADADNLPEGALASVGQQLLRLDDVV